MQPLSPAAAWGPWALQVWRPAPHSTCQAHRAALVRRWIHFYFFVDIMVKAFVTGCAAALRALTAAHSFIFITDTVPNQISLCNRTLPYPTLWARVPRTWEKVCEKETKTKSSKICPKNVFQLSLIYLKSTWSHIPFWAPSSVFCSYLFVPPWINLHIYTDAVF